MITCNEHHTPSVACIAGRTGFYRDVLIDAMMLTERGGKMMLALYMHIYVILMVVVPCDEGIRWLFASLCGNYRTRRS